MTFGRLLEDFWKPSWSVRPSTVGPFVRRCLTPTRQWDLGGWASPEAESPLFHRSKSPNITLNGKRQQKAIEHDPVEIVDFPIEHGGSFHSYVTVYQILINVGLLGDSSIMRCVWEDEHPLGDSTDGKFCGIWPHVVTLFSKSVQNAHAMICRM